MGHQVGTSRPFRQLSLLLVVTLLFVGSALADIVYSNEPYDGDEFTHSGSNPVGQPIDKTGWYYNNVHNDGIVGINTLIPRSGKGSALLATTYNLSKAYIEYLGKDAYNLDGNYYSVTSLGKFKSLEKYCYEWYRSNESTVNEWLHPVLTVLLDADGNFTTIDDRGGLVFELAYNPGPPTAVPENQWVKDCVTKEKFLWSFGLGKPFAYDLDGVNGYAYDSTLEEWQNAPFLENAIVIGFSSGVGSGWAGEFIGAVDNIEWTFKYPTRTSSYNFEVRKNYTEPVPECSLIVFKNGCYYPGTCVRKWGECPELNTCNGALELSTNQRCQPACVGFGVFANCPVDLSKYNQLVFRAKLLEKGDINKCAALVKIELEDQQCKKYCVYVWITNECCDYSIVLAKFKCLDLCRITGLFLLTAFDLVSYSDCQEVVLVFDYIKFVYKPCYTVFDECTAYQYNGQCAGPIILHYWPCQPCATVINNCEGYCRVLVIPCNTWGGGLCGYSQNLKEFKYLSFSLKSTVNIKVEIGDGCGNKACVYVDSTCGQWKCVQTCLSEFCGVDLCDVTWQFMATKCGTCNNEVKIANIKYIYDSIEA